MGRFWMVPALLLLLSACDTQGMPTHVREIENLELIRTMGVDLDEVGVRVTVEGGRHQQEEGGGDPEPPVLLSNAAGTISRAAQEMQTRGNHYMFYGHISEYLVGESLAVKGLAPYLDFVERNLNMRLSTRIFIVKTGTAAEMLAAAAEAKQPISERLESLSKTAGMLSASYPMTASMVITQMDRNGCALCPAILLTEAEEPVPKKEKKEEDGGGEGQTGEEQKGDKAVRPAGYGVIVDRMLVGYLDGEAARGVNLILNEVVTDMVEVKTREGAPAALQVNRAKSRVKPEFEGGELKRVRIVVEIEAAVGEVEGEANFSDDAVMDHFKKQLEEIETRRMEQVILRAQEWGGDFLNIGARVAMAAPAKWGDLRETWARRFPELVIVPEVTAVIRRTYDSNSTMKMGGEA